MIKQRASKVECIVQDIPDLVVEGPEDAPLLIMGWGSTCGAITSACEQLRAEGLPVANTHLRNLHPYPANLEELIRRHDQVLIPEMNMGQLKTLLQAKFLKSLLGLNKMKGQPFKVEEIMDEARAILGKSAVTR